MPKVLTHKGFKSFDGVLISLNKEPKLTLKFKSNKQLKCTLNHRILDKNKNFIFAKHLKIGDIIFGDDILIDIQLYNSEELVYDLLNVSDVNSYFTNNIISHNCIVLDEFAHVSNNLAEEFFTSTYPVISSGKDSKLIIISTPRGMNLFYKIWSEAVSGKNGYAYVDVNWRRIPGRDEKFKEDTIKATSQRQWNQEFESLDRNTYINVNNKEITIGELYDRLKLESGN